jgi:hypothetical protein
MIGMYMKKGLKIYEGEKVSSSSLFVGRKDFKLTHLQIIQIL